MSEVQNWGRTFSLPGKGGHSPLALLCSLCLLLEKKPKQLELQSLLHTSTTTVLAASSSEVFCASVKSINFGSQ